MKRNDIIAVSIAGVTGLIAIALWLTQPPTPKPTPRPVVAPLVEDKPAPAEVELKRFDDYQTDQDAFVDQMINRGKQNKFRWNPKK